VHLDCSSAYIGKLEAEGVIQRQGDGFPLNQSRVAYLRYLWRERRQSSRTEAVLITSGSSRDAAVAVEGEEAGAAASGDFDEAIDSIAGFVLTHLSGLAAPCSNDLAARRKIDAVVYEVRKEMAKAAFAMADKNGEPPLEQ
jgi:hypothetical protein